MVLIELIAWAIVATSAIVGAKLEMVVLSAKDSSIGQGQVFVAAFQWLVAEEAIETGQMIDRAVCVDPHN